jgi:hypothetical protein
LAALLAQRANQIGSKRGEQMTRKDYIRIARALRTTYSSACESGQSADAIEGVLRAAYSIASELAEDNPRFNAWHFLDVVRCVKALESRPPRNDSRSMEHGRMPKGVCLAHPVVLKAVR